MAKGMASDLDALRSQGPQLLPIQWHAIRRRRRWNIDAAQRSKAAYESASPIVRKLLQLRAQLSHGPGSRFRRGQIKIQGCTRIDFGSDCVLRGVSQSELDVIGP